MLQEYTKKQKSKGDASWLSLITSTEVVVDDRQVDTKKHAKLDLFETGLANELKSTDSIDKTLTKIVRMALASEFSAAFVKSQGAKDMIKTLVRGIKEDRGLRKSALMIADKFATK